jgi:hypothetical protein
LNRALWLLLGLQMRGWLRHLCRGMRTVRGTLLVLIGLAVFLPWLLAVLSFPVSGGVDARFLGRYGPASLLFYCVVNFLFSSHERAIYFSPAEVQMLFAGPFGRREVLVYKILLALFVSLPATLLMAAIVRVRDGWPPAVLTGLLLLGIFMQLFGMVLGLLTNTIGARLFSRGRKIVAGLVLVLGIAMLAQASVISGWQPGRWAAQVFDTPVYHVVSWPLQSFFAAMRATRFWPDLLVPLATGLCVNGVLVALVFALDRHYQEASAAASARIYARLQRLRGRSAGAESTIAATRPGRIDVPDLPWWGGVGPIFWRQLTSALRGLGRIVLVLFVLAGGIALPLGTIVEDEVPVGPTVIGLGMWISIFLTALVPFDFRGDTDRIGILKTLPIASWKLVIGQLLTPILLLSMIHYLALAAALYLAPAHQGTILVMAAFVLPFNFVLVALDNLLFLLFPVRLAAATPGDFQAIGRNVLLSLGKVFGLIIMGGLAATVGGIAFLISSLVWRMEKEWVGLAAAWPALALCGACLVPLVALAFQHFDVGRDTPA